MRRTGRPPEWEALFVTLFVVVSAGLVFAGLAWTGGPAKMAAFRRDEQRIRDVLSIVEWVQAPYRSAENLRGAPPSLAGRIRRLESEGNWRDPRTGRPYTVRPLDEERFEVCAIFELSSRDFRSLGGSLPRSSRWEHFGGEVCLAFGVGEPPEPYP